MAFHIDVSHLPSIQTYANAKRIFEDSKPVKGGSQSVKRIGRRYDNTKWLRQDMLDGVEIYVAGFHNTDLVTFYPTHYEISMRGWNTYSTVLFVEQITGCYIYTITESRLAPKGMHGLQEADFRYNNTPITASKRYKFDYNHQPLEPDRHPKVYKYTIDRKAMKEVRDVYRPFINYIKAITKIDRSEVDVSKSMGLPDNTVIAMMKDESQWGQLYESLRVMEAERYYEPNSWNVKWVVSEDNILKKIDSLIKHTHQHTILKSEIVA